MESLFEKLQSNIGNLWSHIRKLWPFNRKNAVKLSPEMVAFQETHKLAMDFATNIVGLTDFVIRVATAQCGYYTDIVYEIHKKEEAALAFDIKNSQHCEQNYKNQDSCYVDETGQIRNRSDNYQHFLWVEEGDFLPLFQFYNLTTYIKYLITSRLPSMVKIFKTLMHNFSYSAVNIF